MYINSVYEYYAFDPVIIQRTIHTNLDIIFYFMMTIYSTFNIDMSLSVF